MEYVSVGCFNDLNERAIESVDGKYHLNFPSPPLLKNDYKTRQQAIQKCAVFAMLQGYKMFGLQDGGMCVTSPTAHRTYNKYGESQDCKNDGKGGFLANQVYRFPGRKGKFMFCESDHTTPEAEDSSVLNPPLLPLTNILSVFQSDMYYQSRVDSTFVWSQYYLKSVMK